MKKVANVTTFFFVFFPVIFVSIKYRQILLTSRLNFGKGMLFSRDPNNWSWAGLEFSLLRS